MSWSGVSVCLSALCAQGAKLSYCMYVVGATQDALCVVISGHGRNKSEPNGSGLTTSPLRECICSGRRASTSDGCCLLSEAEE